MYVVSKENLLKLGVKESDIEKLKKPNTDIIMISSLEDFYKEFVENVNGYYDEFIIDYECEYSIEGVAEREFRGSDDIGKRLFDKTKFDAHLDDMYIIFEDKRNVKGFISIIYKVMICHMIEEISEVDYDRVVITNL